MTKTPEVLQAAVSDAANEQLLVAADTQKRLLSLADALPKATPPADSVELRGQSLTAATKTLRERGRSPEEIAAFTLERGYPVV